MGLRFRKRVKICKGLTLNLGKTGASVTVGSGCLKKTFHTNGNVTTTASLPGTGIYWTDTKRSGSRQTRQASAASVQRFQNPLGHQSDPFAEDTAFHSSRQPNAVTSVPSQFDSQPQHKPVVHEASQASRVWSAEEIRSIYAFCDDPIEWTELISGATAEELMMEQQQYEYCRRIAPKILSGDVNTYMEAIETIQPVNDLLLYSGDFEFGTDKPGCMEVEFTARPEGIISADNQSDKLQQFICAVSIRVARDLMSLLPVSRVLVHTEIDSHTVLSVLFIRNEMAKINFNIESIPSIMAHFEHRLASTPSQNRSVERLNISSL